MSRESDGMSWQEHPAPTVGIIADLCADDLPIVLIDGNAWAGSFPAGNVPAEWKDLDVVGIAPDKLECDGSGSCTVLKVWV